MGRALHLLFKFEDVGGVWLQFVHVFIHAQKAHVAHPRLVPLPECDDGVLAEGEYLDEIVLPPSNHEPSIRRPRYAQVGAEVRTAARLEPARGRVEDAERAVARDRRELVPVPAVSHSHTRKDERRKEEEWQRRQEAEEEKRQEEQKLQSSGDSNNSGWENFNWNDTETDVFKIALSFYSGLFAYNG